MKAIFAPLSRLFSTALFIAAISQGAPAKTVATPVAQSEARCAELGAVRLQGGRVTSATFESAAAAKAGSPEAPARPANCVVQGSINQRIGIDGRPYAIRFELRLPAAWSGRFYYQGGAGVDGVVPPADGVYPSGEHGQSALLSGMAVVTTDSGHEAVSGVGNGAFLFGADPQARDEYGDQQLPLVTDAAKRLIAQYYGRAPEWSYFYGCSNGGRQAMAAAQKWPYLFDGIIACSPGFRLAQASIQGSIVRAQLAATIAPKKADGTPDISHALTAAQQDVIKALILRSCDALDGVADGMVSHPSQCRVEPLKWVCAADQSQNCLSPEVARYVRAFLAGGTLRDGRVIYSSIPADPQIVQYMGSEPEMYVGLFAGEASHVYTTPPTMTPDLIGYALKADADTEYRKLFASSAVFTRSGADFTNADSPNMDAFQRHGGKIIIYSGSADWAFPSPDVEAYYQSVQKRYGKAGTDSFARLYIVPGMLHGPSPYATDRFDVMGAMIDWVERGAAPDTLLAKAAPDAAWPGRTRPLCAFPKESTYNGSGSIEQATSFHCHAP
ncbi:tannase/feruloyl esterase family alpha/beta hydrolase [Sphingomonas oleivorans]|nr:tannase/feruloyl esterase family alpha/beta hydrolase [Sphingomonas oleivorans]